MTSTHGNKDQRILIKECCSLVKAGYDVCQVAQGDSGEYNGVRLIGTGETNKSAFYRLFIRPRIVYKLALEQNADIYQIHDMELLPYGLKLKRKGKKVIFDYHEDFASRFADSDVFHLPKFLMKLLGRLYCSYEKKTISKLDAMISVTPHICERLKKYNSRTIMITNYPITSDNNLWSSPCTYNADSDYICFAGQVSSVQYGLDVAIEAIQDLDIKFKIYGAERRVNDINCLKKLDIFERTVFCGSIPYDKLPFEISNSRIAIVTPAYTKDTNEREGTLGSNKLFEAMLRGVPVVFTNYNIWMSINDKYKFGLGVEYGNKKEIREAIKFLLDNIELAKTLGENGRKAVLGQYNWKTQEENLLQLYKEIEGAINENIGSV